MSWWLDGWRQRDIDEMALKGRLDALEGRPQDPARVPPHVRAAYNAGYSAGATNSPSAADEVAEVEFLRSVICDLRYELDRMSIRVHNAECALGGHKTPICGECVAKAIIGELEPKKRWRRR